MSLCRQTDLPVKGGNSQSLMMQRIIVKVLQGGTEIAVYRFLNPPTQAASIMGDLRVAGYEGVLQKDNDTYFGNDLIHHGVYALRVS